MSHQAPAAGGDPPPHPSLQPCVKCGGQQFRNERIRTTGNGVSRLLNLQNQKFLAHSCTHCGFTELYRADTSALGNALDLLLGT